MAVAYGGFALALVMLLLLIYQDVCTYTANIIIDLYMISIGCHLVLQPITSGAFDAQDVDWSEYMVCASSNSTCRHLGLVLDAISHICKIQFAPTPGGTSFFLFSLKNEV